MNDGLAADCPRVALFIVATLPKIRTHEQFMRVRAAWETAVASLGPSGERCAGPVGCTRAPGKASRTYRSHCGRRPPPRAHPVRHAAPPAPLACVQAAPPPAPPAPRHRALTPRRPPGPTPAGTIAIATMTENEDGAIAAWTTILFPAPVASGTVAARATMQKLLGNVVGLFDQRVFGQVHMETVSAPTLVRATSGARAPARLPPAPARVRRPACAPPLPACACPARLPACAPVLPASAAVLARSSATRCPCVGM